MLNLKLISSTFFVTTAISLASIGFATLVFTRTSMATSSSSDIDIISEKKLTFCPITTYKQSLPMISTIGQENDDKIVDTIDRILGYLKEYGNGSDLNIESRRRYTEKMRERMENEQPLIFVILGFPCKSKNTDTKVITDTFDLGDYLGLVTLQNITEKITYLYPFGCSITIINREPYIEAMGKIAERILGINPYPIECIESYERVLNSMLADFPNLSLGKNMSNIYNEAYLQRDEEQNIPSKAPGRVPGEIINFYVNDLNTKAIKTKLQNLIDQEKVQLTLERKSTKNVKGTKTRLEEIAKLLAEEREKGTAILRKLVSREYSDCLRLSIRGDETKVGINMVYGSSRAPWHMTPVISESGAVSLMDLSRLEKEKAKIPYLTRSIILNEIELLYVIR